MDTVRVVTDSTADIPGHLARDLGIAVVPVHVIFGTQSYDDGVTISRDEFYTRLMTANPLPTTSAPSAGAFESVYRRLKDEGARSVVSVHVAAALSGVQNAARSGAGGVPALGVTIVDSEQVSMGLGWQVIEAARAARDGKPVEAVVEAAAGVRQRVRLFAALDTLEYVRRSGRVGWAAAAIGQLLKIKPIVSVEGGAVLSIDRTRTRRHSVERLLQLAAEHGPLQALAVLHTHAREAAHDLAETLGRQHPGLRDPIHIVEATTAIGTHVGPNGLGVACVAAG